MIRRLRDAVHEQWIHLRTIVNACVIPTKPEPWTDTVTAEGRRGWQSPACRGAGRGKKNVPIFPTYTKRIPTLPMTKIRVGLALRQRAGVDYVDVNWAGCLRKNKHDNCNSCVARRLATAVNNGPNALKSDKKDPGRALRCASHRKNPWLWYHSLPQIQHRSANLRRTCSSTSPKSFFFFFSFTQNEVTAVHYYMPWRNNTYL